MNSLVPVQALPYESRFGSIVAFVVYFSVGLGGVVGHTIGSFESR